MDLELTEAYCNYKISLYNSFISCPRSKKNFLRLFLFVQKKMLYSSKKVETKTF